MSMGFLGSKKEDAMELPAEIRIGPILYTVEEVDDLRGTSGEHFLGLADPALCKIFIDKELPPQSKLITYVHEVLHLIMEHAGRTDHDEGVINAISYGLVDVMSSNKDFCDFLSG